LRAEVKVELMVKQKDVLLVVQKVAVTEIKMVLQSVVL